MESEKVLILKVLDRTHENIKYSIDSPRSGNFKSGVEVLLKFSGWIYTLDGRPASFVFSHQPGHRFFPTKSRPDVQKAHPKAPLNSGLLFALEFNSDFKIGVECDGDVTWVACVSCTVAKVIRGVDGHLFLANDLNNSVEQFKGNRLIDSDSMGKWGGYFDFLNLRLDAQECLTTFMVAPGKEYVFPDLFPEVRGGVTPTEQFVVSFSEKVKIVNPTKVLVSEREFSYCKTDTHWTEYGASLAAQLFCRDSGYEYFNPDISYVVVKNFGDLGEKLYPQKAESALMVQNKDFLKKHQVFNNNVMVRGNIIIYENDSAKNPQTLLVFGDSYSVDLTDFLSHSFARVVRVFSGADIDWGAIEFENPDHILIELTSRFLVRAPNQNFSIVEEMKIKYNSMNTQALDEHISRLVKARCDKNMYYVDACLSAVNHIRSKR